MNYYSPTYQCLSLRPPLLLQIYSQSQATTISHNNKHAIFSNDFKGLWLWQYQATGVMQHNGVSLI